MAKKKTTTTKKKTTTPKKKTAAAKPAAKKAAPKKTAAAKKAPAKKAVPQKKAGKGSDLLFRSFDRWKPDKPYAPPADPRAAEYSAPSADKGVPKDIRFRKFDFDFTALAKPPEEKPPQEKSEPKLPAAKPVSAKELIRRDFGAWKPKTFYAPVPSEIADRHGSPGFGSNVNRDVLFRKFDDIDFAAVAKPPKPAPPPRKPVSREELIRRVFGAWKPETYYAPPRDDSAANYAAPDFGAGVKRDVLTRKFDDLDFAAIAKPPKPPAPPRKPVSREELLWKDFGTWKPDTPYTPPPASDAERFTAPPMDDGASRDVRFRKFDFDFEALAREAEQKRTEETPSEEEAARPKSEAEETPSETEKPASEPSEAPDETVIKLSETKERDPMDRNITFLAAGIILLFILIGAASYSNSSKYYVEPTDDGVQIWKGRFSPLGQKLLADLDGVAPPEPLQPVYTREAALTLAFNHFMSRVDQELGEPTRVDFDKLDTLLNRTGKFAVTDAQKLELNQRRTDIQLMTYLYRANAAASRGARSGLSDAIELLEEAALLKLSPQQTTFVERQIELMEDMKSTAPEAPPAEKATENLEVPAPESNHGAERAPEGEGHGPTLEM